MLGFSALGETVLGGQKVVVVGPDPSPIDVTKIPADRKVVFGGGTRVVVFDGGIRTVVFQGGTRTVRF